MIANYQECQNIIKQINSDIDINPGFMQNPEEQYQQRNKYIEVLKYAVSNNELYHLYDIWQVFAKAREQATRGFFLDLWDIYEKQEFSGKYQRERNILRHFVGQINNQFDEILLAKEITAPRLWQDYIQELLNDLMWIENEHEQQLQRKLLYSMSHLYTYLYPQISISAEEEKKSLSNHLAIANEASFCREKEDDFSIVLKKVFDKNDNSQRQFTLTFLYLYRFINHFGIISLEDFVNQVFNSLKEEEFIKGLEQESGKELLDRLLRYWGANSPLMKFFLEEKLDFQFYEYDEKEVINLSSPYGTDNFVYTIGASGVGKTYLLHAMEHFSKKYEEQVSLSIEYIDASKVSREEDRKKWEQGEELKVRENHLIYMRSKVRNLCRFTFYEIEDTQIIKDTVTKRQSLQGYFERRLPSAIILVFSSEEKDNFKSYDFLVNLLDRLAKKDESYRSIPIYFIFNQSDQLFANGEKSQEMFNEFQRYLNSKIKISEGFNFFTLRYQKEVKKNTALGVANQTKACCSNLAFIKQLNQDLERVDNIIDRFLDFNFTNLSFIYTSSLFNPDKQYTDLQTLWNDITDFLIQATSKDIEKYYRQEFQEKLKSNFRYLNLFCQSAEMNSASNFNEDIFKGLNTSPNLQKIEEDFRKFKIEVETKDKIDEFNISSLLKFGIEFLNYFVKGKNIIKNSLDNALRENLKELGIPIEKNQIEKNQNNQDFYLKEIEFIEPENINYYDYIWQFHVNSPSVKSFTETIEYQKLTEEIENILDQKIFNYNEDRSDEDKLTIEKNHLNILIKQLPLQLQAIDIANKSEAFNAPIEEKYLFSDALNNTNALCPIQCGQFEESDRNFIQGEDREQTVFERLCQFTDLEEAKKYCQLLTNYLPKYHVKPKYPQFLLVKRHRSNKIQVELDEIKISVIKSLNEKIKQQQKLLVDMIIILLRNQQEFEKQYQNTSKNYEYEKYLTNLYLAKYLLKILESQGFNIQQFKEEPSEMINLIASAINNLVEIMEAYKAESENINLDSFVNAYQKITTDTKFYSLNSRDITNKAKEIEIELKTAFHLYRKIFSLVEQDNELLKELSKDIIQKFSLSQTNEYNKLLKDYQEQRKLLIIRERVEYLRASKWIEDLEWLNDSFKEYPDFIIWGNLNSLDTEDINNWKEGFMENIDKLLKAELFSHEIK